MLRRALLALLLLAPVLSGCLGADDPTTQPREEPTAPPEPGDRPTLVQPTFLPPVDLGPVWSGAEPNVAVGPAGEVYVSTTGALWRSDDGGRTYTSLNDVRCGRVMDQEACRLDYHRHPGLDGMGDTDVVVTADGRVHWLALFGEHGTVPYQVSGDRGETFSEVVDLADGEEADREWIAARDDGRLYATWRAFGDRDRLAFHRSTDGGATWSDEVTIDDDHLQGPIALDPTSERIYIPMISYAYDGSVLVARSVDDGLTWETLEAVPPDGADRSERSRNPTYIFPVAAVDRAGTVYVVWANDADGGPAQGNKDLSIPSVWLTVSTDGGDTWTEPRRLSEPDRAAVMPWIAAGEAGRVVVVWYENTAGAPNELLPGLWNVRLVQSVDADAPSPSWVGGLVNEEPVHVGAICTSGGGCGNGPGSRDRSMLDFFEVDITADGRPVVAWAVDGDPADVRTRVHAGGVADGTRLW